MLPVLAPPDVIERSLARRSDNFYKPPPYVEMFIARVNQESPGLVVAKLWSIPRQVNVTRVRDGAEFIVTYDCIEDHVVAWLDRCAAFAREPAGL